MDKRGKDLGKLDKMIYSLAEGDPLDADAKRKDHALVENRKGFGECHIEPDSLLIYRIEENILDLEETGSDS